MPLPMHAPPQEIAMAAKLYCKLEMPAPNRIVVLGDPSAQTDLVDGLRIRELEQYPVQVRNASKLHRQYGHVNATPYAPASPPLVSELKQPGAELGNYKLFPHIPGGLFTWPYTHEHQIAVEEGVENHNLTMRRAMEEIKISPKHFHEVNIKEDPAGYGSHYDWRFFREILSHDEHRAVLHAMARAWQQFAEEAGIVYWYAHGSLLGYHWNGLAMPWDSDHDIQMPVFELNRLAEYFNHTLIVQHPNEGGHHKYFLDVNPFYVKRIHGNGNNVIDARFIDIDTGAYIDITGLARTNPSRRLVSCKNRHFYHATDFSRLRRTLFEAYPALIPSKYEHMLNAEYPKYKWPTYKQWEYNERIRLWEYKGTCYQYLLQYKFSHHVYCFPQDIHLDDKCMDEYGTCDNVNIELYNLTSNVTELHQTEMQLYTDDVLDGLKPFDAVWNERALENVRELEKIVGKYIPPFLESANNNYRLAKTANSQAANLQKSKDRKADQKSKDQKSKDQQQQQQQPEQPEQQEQQGHQGQADQKN